MRRFRKGCRCIVIGVLIFVHAMACAQQDVRISIDPGSQFQNIYGFGASDAWRCQFVGANWPIEKRERIADLLFSKAFDRQGNPKGIGLSIWRFYIGAGSNEQGDSSGMGDVWRRAECFQLPDGTYDWTKHKGQRWFLNAARKRGVEKFLAFTIAAPVHMSLNGKAFNGTRKHNMNIVEGKLPDYATFLVDVVEHFKTKEGIVFDYLSPVNEPQWLWDKPTQEGTPATNEEMYRLTKLLSQQLQHRKLPTRVLLGEAGAIQYLYSDVKNADNDLQIREFYGVNSPLNIASLPNVQRAITGHSYFTTWPVDKLISHRVALRDTLHAVDPGLEYWQTEYCILEKNDDVQGGWKRDLGMNTALFFARVIHHDLVVANASSWQFWTALSEANFKDGLIYIDNGNNGVEGSNHPDSRLLQQDGFVRDSKTLWMFGNYSRFVKPGMKRIDIAYQDKSQTAETIAVNLMVSAFADEKNREVAIVCVNYSNDTKRLTIDKVDKMFGGKFDVFTTSAEKNLEHSRCAVNAVEIGPKSVVTLVGNLKK